MSRHTQQQWQQRYWQEQSPVEEAKHIKIDPLLDLVQLRATIGRRAKITLSASSTTPNPLPPTILASCKSWHTLRVSVCVCFRGIIKSKWIQFFYCLFRKSTFGKGNNWQTVSMKHVYVRPFTNCDFPPNAVEVGTKKGPMPAREKNATKKKRKTEQMLRHWLTYLLSCICYYG